MASELPFVSQDLKIGDPPGLSWSHFEKPKLRRFPLASFTLLECLGSGVDGIAVKVNSDCHPQPLVLKIFLDRDHPQPLDPGYISYFPFNRECTNAALLELIIASSRRAIASGQPIYVNPNPKTLSEALQNIRAFSVNDDMDQGTTASETVTAMVKPFPENGDDEAAVMAVNSCLGWMEVDMENIMKDLDPLLGPEQREVLPNNKAFCIVYPFVPDQGPLDKEKITRQTNFFHMTGFHQVEFKWDNWRGEGVLVDHSDLVSPWDYLWQMYQYDYAGFSSGYGSDVEDYFKYLANEKHN